MQRLCVFGTAIVLSYLGWFLGGHLGGLMASFFLAGALALLGVWIGWRLHQRFFF